MRLNNTMLAESVIAVSLIVGAAVICIAIFGFQTYMVATGKIKEKDPQYRHMYPYHHGLLPVF